MCRNTSATDSADHFPYNTKGFQDLNQQSYMFFLQPSKSLQKFTALSVEPRQSQASWPQTTKQNHYCTQANDFQDDLTNLDIVGGHCLNNSIRQNVTFGYQGLPFGLDTSNPSSSKNAATGQSQTLATFMMPLLLTASLLFLTL